MIFYFLIAVRCIAAAGEEFSGAYTLSFLTGCYSCVKMLISCNVKMLSFKQNIIDILFVSRCFQLVSKFIGLSVL